eukprot:GFKZ01007297.1.p1 GENE.GFKZ01007297.1~~GFKZ01007297.1.p1  ORF type:complete len:433 (+),score=30.29 GFKZ01007297.1:154-1452(+)
MHHPIKLCNTSSCPDPKHTRVHPDQTRHTRHSCATAILQPEPYLNPTPSSTHGAIPLDPPHDPVSSPLTASSTRHVPPSLLPFTPPSMAPSLSSSTLKQAACLATAFAAGATISHIYNLRHRPPTLITHRLSPSSLLAAVELGGTSCRAAVAYLDDPTTIVDETELPTTDPHSTTNELCRFLRKHAPFISLGIASFGPIDLDQNSQTYGHITTTPKPGWQHFNLIAAFSEFPVPIGFDTDVNAPALAELRYGNHKPADSCAYITVGTGVGVGLVVNHAPVHGLVHPEGGHISTLRKPNDAYPGWSTLHPLCVESMASARACAERAGVDPHQLCDVSDEHPVWDDVAYYLAQLCLTITYVASPHLIVLSGGVMKRQVLFEKIRSYFSTFNNGYIAADRVIHHLDSYIVPSTFGNQIGIIGAIELARRAIAGLK